MDRTMRGPKNCCRYPTVSFDMDAILHDIINKCVMECSVKRKLGSRKAIHSQTRGVIVSLHKREEGSNAPINLKKGQDRVVHVISIYESSLRRI